MTESKTRNISIDILKILSMLMVIVLHTKTYGLENEILEPQNPIFWLVWTFHIFSLVAVNCFVLISGYFSSNSTTSPKKILKLWLQVATCSIGIYLVFCAIPNSGIELSFGNLLVNAFPFMSNRYWFFTCYFVLMILSPYLNKFINSMEQKDFKKILGVLLLLFVVIPSLNVFGDSSGTSRGFSVVWFIILYFIAAYLRRYPLPKKPYGLFYLIICISSVFAHSVLNKLNDYLPLFGQTKDIFIRYNGAPVFLSSICLFLFFLQHPINTKKSIQKIITDISSVSLSVYLIHEHPAIRDYLWNNIVQLYETTNSIPHYLLRFSLSVICIFVSGTIFGKVLSIIISAGEKLILKIRKKM